MKRLLKEYKPTELLKSFLTKWIFVIPFAAIFFIITINILLLYVPYMKYFFLSFYLFVTITMYYTNNIFINTLKNYKVIEQFSYFKLRIILTLIESILTIIILIIVYAYLN
jgi:hypothetical protein